MQATAYQAANGVKSGGTSQVNVRMDRALKSNGDAALAEVGLSPSDAVRKLWEVMAKRGKARMRLLEALGMTDERAARQAEREHRMALVESIASRHARVAGTASVDPASLPVLTDEDWEELIWADFDARRGGGSLA